MQIDSLGFLWKKFEIFIDRKINYAKIIVLFHNQYSTMSAGHDDHGDHGAKKSSGKSMDFGITSMIGGFFGTASGAGVIEKFKEGGGGWGWHDHGHH